MEKIEVRKGCFVTRLKDGTLKNKEWYDENGNLHRDSGPAKINYRYNEEIDDCYIASKYWYNHGILVHYSIYTNYEIPIRDRYYNAKGQYHREGGPAIITYDDCGEIIEEQYYINGKRIKNELQIQIINGLVEVE